MATKDGRCDEHQRQAWENTSKRNLILDPWKWKKAKTQHLLLEPACRVCGSTEHLHVDHITELADDGEPYDESNLQTLCEEHHEEKSQRAKRLRRARMKTQRGRGV